MTMTPRLWSLNALATEFGRDRRTVARLLRDVRPAGDLHGKPAWMLADVAPLLTAPAATGKGKTRNTPPAIPDAFASLSGLPAWEQCVALAVALVAMRAPATCAALAVDRGLAPASAGPALLLSCLGGIGTEAQSVLDDFGIRARLADMLTQADPVNWHAFAGFDLAEAERREADMLTRAADAVA
jgi:hypothetical protein